MVCGKKEHLLRIKSEVLHCLADTVHERSAHTFDSYAQLLPEKLF